jgi:hypothetical protein
MHCSGTRHSISGQAAKLIVRGCRIADRRTHRDNRSLARIYVGETSTCNELQQHPGRSNVAGVGRHLASSETMQKIKAAFKKWVSRGPSEPRTALPSPRQPAIPAACPPVAQAYPALQDPQRVRGLQREVRNYRMQ